MNISRKEIRSMIMEELQRRVETKRKQIAESNVKKTEPVQKKESSTVIREAIKKEVRKALMEELFGK